MTSEVILGQNLYLLDALEGTVEQVIRQLPLRSPDGHYLVDDGALRATALTAQSASKAIWKLGCAARAEIIRRLSERTQDSAALAREVAREAAEEGVSVRTFKRDAAVGMAYGPLFAEPDAAPDLSPSFYSIALKSPDPPAALALAAQRKDQNPLYSTSDFEADIARARMADPVAGYGVASEGRCGMAYLAPYWSEGVLEATEKALALPLHQWLLPDSLVLIRTPPRALDLGCRIMNAHNLSYQQCIFLPAPPFRDGNVWHTTEILLIGTRGHLRLPDTIPGEWRDPKIERCLDLYFPFATPKLAVYPRRGMGVGAGWVTVNDLPDHVR